MTQGCQLLARVTSRLVLRPFQSLADGSYLAKIYPCESGGTRTARVWWCGVIRYTLNDPQRSATDRNMCC